MRDRRLIGDILSEQRRARGLSIDRVVTDTKLQQRIIEAFEYSDFDTMPPKGYAQASLASYARYLGLDTVEILDVYERQLAEYQRDQDRRARGDASSASGRNTAQGSYRGRYDEGGSRRASRSNRPADSSRGRVETEPNRREMSQRRTRSTQSAPRQQSGRGYDPHYAYTRATSSVNHGERRYSEDRPGYVPSEGRYRRTDSSGARISGNEPPVRDSHRVDRRARTEGNPSRRNPAVSRGQTQAFTLNSGYEGGSGGSISGGVAPRPSLGQLLQAILVELIESIRGDKLVLRLSLGAALVLVVVIAISAVSCVSSRLKPTTETVGTVPISAVSDPSGVADSLSSNIVDGTKLNPSVDLTALPVNSIVSVSMAAESQDSPYLEVAVDGIAVYADLISPSTYLEWSVGRNITIRLSSIEGITVSVAGTTVTPVLEGGTYSLTASVPEAQWVVAAGGEQVAV